MSDNQITTATNLVGPDLSNSQSLANKFFNNFYSVNLSAGPASDAILAFFEGYAKNKTAGKNLAASVLYTAQVQGLDPMVVLDEFKKLPAGEINNYLAAFLNINRVPTSSIGIKYGTNINPLVERTILP